jgi:hypothetical protein
MSEQHPDVIGPDGQAVHLPDTATGTGGGAPGGGGAGGTPLGELVEQPAKVMRIGAMIRQLLEEVKAAPLDEASRSRLRTIHLQSVEELKDGLAPELVDELERLSLPFEGEAPSEGELRIAQAQLVGWLEGLFHGIQAALYAQQVQAQSQLQTMRLALPGPNDSKGNDSESSGESGTSGGMYL